MKLLFVMQSPGYIRNYDGVIRLLLERGHDVHLGFERPGKYAEFLDLLSQYDAQGRLTSGPAPRRKDMWSRLAMHVRATMDYIRYLEGPFRNADGLRRRMEKRVPGPFRFLTSLPTLPSPIVRGMLWLLSQAEAAIPSDPRLEQYIRDMAPDALLITPLVTVASEQTDVVKSAKAVGVPTALCVGSWDHLTTKGLIRIQPDRVIVWNDTQKHEAVTLHGTHPENVSVTGAQLFDHWFDRTPSCSARELQERVGLDPDCGFVLFVGSTASISSPEAEVEYVFNLIRALRGAADPDIRRLGVLIRPHPYNATHWGSVDLSDYSNVALWRHGGVQTLSNAEDKALHFDELGKAGYFDSFTHSRAVIGINSSALIEAAIVGRPVFTIATQQFAITQYRTLHFQYLLPENGGFLRVAPSMEAFVDQLRETIQAQSAAPETRRFVESFVRPCGLTESASAHVVAAVESLAALTVAPTTPRAPWIPALRSVLGKLAQRTTDAARKARQAKQVAA